MSEGPSPAFDFDQFSKEQPNSALAVQPPDPEDTAAWLSAVENLNLQVDANTYDLIRQSIDEQGITINQEGI